MNEVNKTLQQMIYDLHETSSNERKVLRQEIEALRADKVVKDEHLNMLYTVMEHKLGINVQAVAQMEKELAEAATQKKKGLIVETQEVPGSSSHPESTDVEMTEAEVNAEVDPEQGFVLIGEASSRPYSLKEVICLVKVEQRKGKVREADMKLLCYKEETEEEEEQRLKEEELKRLYDDIDNFDPMYDFDDDVEDQHQESSSSGKQHADQVFLTQPTIIYLHSAFERELEAPRTREEMLEELGMDDGNLKFDIEDEIPSSPERDYVFKLANEADHFNDVIVEEGSDVSDEDTPFHYSCADDTFPTFTEIFKSHNEDEVCRKVVEKMST
ncbi:hypothetical protein Hanom_Chr02g00168511 [Helianthus anomalus]